MTATSATGSSFVVNGLVSGLNTSQVIQALLTGYQVPITSLENQQSALSAQAADYQALNSDMQGVLTAAQSLNTTSAWQFTRATTSDSTVATATTAAGAQVGSLTFDVTALAQGNVLASSGSVTSQGTQVTTDPSMLLATGSAALGLSSLDAGSGLALGSHSVTVTQSSAAASLSATGTAASTTITAGTNDTLDLSVNGTAYSLTLAAGSYDPAQLAAAVSAAATAAGAAVGASVDGTGELQLATARQGSAATLAVTGGDAASSVGLSVAPSATGADGVVSVDGTSTTLTSIDPGQAVTLSAGHGTLGATVAAAPGPSGALLSAGTAHAALVSTGNGSLAQVVGAVNGSGLAVTANAVKLASGSYLLQISANQTGLAGSVSVDPAALAGSPLGHLSIITTAQDAAVSVGGPGGYAVTSSNDTFTGLLPGTTVTVAAQGTATVTVTPDATAAATAVGGLVSAANKALTDINSYTAYDPSTKTAGPLMGSAVLTGLRQQILSVFSGVAGTSGLGNASDVGIKLASSGTVSFDQGTFESAYNADPSQVAGLFTQGGTFAASGSGSGSVSFVYAGTRTQPGAYDVAVTSSAAQARVNGTMLGGPVSVGETLTVTAGGQSASYATTAGEALATVAAGLNRAFASAGLDLTAGTDPTGGQLQIVSNGYGSSVGFSVSSSATGPGTTGLGGAVAGTPITVAGTDVAGTINGTAAVGSGQVLAADSADPVLAGLSLLVTATGVSSPTDLGSFTYQPGVAQLLAAVADQASNAQGGSLTDTVKSLHDQAQGFTSQIARYQGIENSQQAVLQNEFANLEATLGSLKNQSSMIASQIAGLP